MVPSETNQQPPKSLELDQIESVANRLPLNEKQFKVHELLEGLSLQKDQFGQWYLAALESLNERGRDYLSQAAHSIREITDKLPTRAGVPMFRSPLPQTRDAVVNLLRIKSDSYESGWEGAPISGELAATLGGLEQLQPRNIACSSTRARQGIPQCWRFFPKCGTSQLHAVS